LSTSSKNMLRDLGGKLIPQYYDPIADEYQALEGDDGALKSQVEDGKDVTQGALDDAPATTATTDPWSVVALLKGIFAKLLATIGVTIADGSSVSLGARADAAATTDAGTFSLISLTKRLLEKITAGLSVTVTGSSQAITTLQNAVTATGNGTALSVAGLSTVVFDVSGTFVGTITFEAQVDSQWVSLLATAVGTPVIASTATAAGEYRASVAGLTNVRARVSAYTSGTITVKANATAAVTANKSVLATSTDKHQQLYTIPMDYRTSADGERVAKTAERIFNVPHVTKYKNANTNIITGAPSSGDYLESTTAVYTAIATLDGSTNAVTQSGSGQYGQRLFSFDLLAAARRQIKADMTVAELRASIQYFDYTWVGWGTGASGGISTNGATVKRWNVTGTPAWDGVQTNTAASPSALTASLGTSTRIDDSGFVHILAHSTHPSDGVIASVIYTDYISVTMQILGERINVSARTDGDVAHDDPDSGNPVKIGYIAEATIPAAVADGDRVNAAGTLYGAAFVNPVTALGAQVTGATGAAIPAGAMAIGITDSTSGFLRGARSANRDAEDGHSLLSVVPAGFNGSTADRLRTASIGDGAAATGILANGNFIWNGSTWDRILSAAAADGSSSLGKPSVSPYLYNGATWDKTRNNTEGTLLASAERTATTTSSVIVNYNAKFLVVFVNITVASGTGGLRVGIRSVDPVTAVATQVNTFMSPRTTTGVLFHQLALGLGAATGNVSDNTNALVPRQFSIQIAHSDSSSYTYSVGYSLIV